jgi:hypothetical protein
MVVLRVSQQCGLHRNAECNPRVFLPPEVSVSDSLSILIAAAVFALLFVYVPICSKV